MDTLAKVMLVRDVTLSKFSETFSLNRNISFLFLRDRSIDFGVNVHGYHNYR